MTDILFYSFIIVLGLLGIASTYLSHANTKINEMKSTFSEMEKKLKPKTKKKTTKKSRKKIKK
tara:strand:- start:49 stop:237 length:189 start_codon:yes stop_codon:yes gene_type:complete